jgi:dihydrolipoamide dehydrogenase
VPHVAILGGGPAGYEAALVAAQLGAEVTLVEPEGVGGACVLTDCVPSKTLVATAAAAAVVHHSDALGVRFSDGGGRPEGGGSVDLARANARVRGLARAQSQDIGARLSAEGVRVLAGHGRLLAPDRVLVRDPAGRRTELVADVVLLATGACPRVLPQGRPDGERILDWRQLYDLDRLPEALVVVGSGVTGAEFASAFQEMGSPVTLISSRDRVLPGEDEDAARVLETVLGRAGMRILKRARADAVRRTRDGVLVRLTDGRSVEGSHALIAIGSEPVTAGLGLAEAGVRCTPTGHVAVDRMSRTSLPRVYAAGDCTGVLLLASVAAMQGRIAMWHALGEAVSPLRLSTVAATVFTSPEIATVGISADKPDGASTVHSLRLPLATNPRAKMREVRDGFVKLFCRGATGTVVGAVVVAPEASELILPLSLAVQHGLTVDQLAHTFAVYPSLTGSVTEAARQLMSHAPD